MSFAGCIYADEPEDDKYKLSLEQLRGMNFVGLPVRVEHHARDAGRVMESWIDDQGHAFVRCQLDDDVRGWGLAKLIDCGAAQELSLKHAVHEDGTLTPLEVSVVRRGARPGTTVLPKASQYITASAGEARGTAAMEAQPPAAAAPPPAAAPAAAPAAPPPAVDNAAIAAEAEQQAAAKRARTDDGRFAAGGEEHGARRAKLHGTADKLIKVAEAVLPHVKDPAVTRELLASITDMMQSSVAAEEIITKKDRELATLLETVGANKGVAEEMARKVVDGLSLLWHEMDRKISPEDRQLMEDVYLKNPKFAMVSQPITVAASWLAARQAQKAKEVVVDELQAAKTLMAQMTSQLNTYGGMSTVAASAVPVAEAPAAAPPRWAAPAVAMVAASAREEAPMRLQMPAALAGMENYTGTVGTMSRDDLRHK